MNEESIQLMKQAGCHTIIFGVEFGNDTNLEASQKDLVSSEIDKAIALCKKHGVRTVRVRSSLASQARPWMISWT